MRNYVESFYGRVTYHLKPPNPPNPQKTYFIAGDRIAMLSQMELFKSELDPNFFIIDTTEDLGRIYWLLNKENFLELVNIVSGWWNFVGTTLTSPETPRKSWSHGH